MSDPACRWRRRRETPELSSAPSSPARSLALLKFTEARSGGFGGGGAGVALVATTTIASAKLKEGRRPARRGVSAVQIPLPPCSPLFHSISLPPSLRPSLPPSVPPSLPPSLPLGDGDGKPKEGVLLKSPLFSPTRTNNQRAHFAKRHRWKRTTNAKEMEKGNGGGSGSEERDRLLNGRARGLVVSHALMLLYFNFIHQTTETDSQPGFIIQIPSKDRITYWPAIV